MNENRKINWDAIFPDVEERWQTWENLQRQKYLHNLSLPVEAPDWILLCKLVRAKKGKGMDGGAVEHYLEDFFEVPDLGWITRKEVQEAIQFLARLPDEPVS